MRTILTIISVFVFAVMLNGQSKNEQLIEAIQKNEKDKAELLLKAGCDPNYIKIGSPYMEVTPLILAVQTQNISMVNLLIDNKANINWKDNLKSSAIIYSVSSGNLAMTKLLAEHGANLNEVNGENKSVLSLAKEFGNKDLVAFIESKLSK
jgi:ankyrin repeat protein